MVMLIAMLLSLVLLTTAQAADFDAGLAAYNRGEYAEALRQWRPLAEQGYRGAQYNLGLMYANGRGVPQDDAEAVKWYRRAAEQGEARAQGNLGFMYEEGRGVAPNAAMAVKWYRRSALQGRAFAQYRLGFMYAEGEGVSQDHVQAFVWSYVAVAQGIPKAEAPKVKALVSMTAEEMSRARVLARQYWEAYVRPFASAQIWYSDLKVADMGSKGTGCGRGPWVPPMSELDMSCGRLLSNPSFRFDGVTFDINWVVLYPFPAPLNAVGILIGPFSPELLELIAKPWKLCANGIAFSLASERDTGDGKNARIRNVGGAAGMEWLWSHHELTWAAGDSVRLAITSGPCP